jgi:hypothetical protein
MKTSKIILGSFILITLTAMGGLVKNVSAQKCAPVANQIYFIDPSTSSKTPVTGVHPENPYTLVVVGTETDLFEARQSWYLASISLLSANTNETRWNVEFAANQAMDITTVQLGIKCSSNRARWYSLNSKVRLFNQ